MESKKITDFTKMYSVPKTLRFYLIPQGKTLEFIQAGSFLSDDEMRAKAYQEMKKSIDAYHIDFIEKSMNSLKANAKAQEVLTSEKQNFKIFSGADLEQHAKKYDDFKKARKSATTEEARVQSSKIREAYNKSCKSLRAKIITSSFKSAQMAEKFTHLFKGELIKNYLGEFVVAYNESNPTNSLLFNDTFKTFTTYFTGFHENRKNMYSVEEQSTAIAYRIINENFPKYHDNSELFTKNECLLQKCIQSLSQENQEFLQSKGLHSFTFISKYIDCFSQTGIDVYNSLIGGFVKENGDKLQGLNEIINIYNQKCTTKAEKIPLFKKLYKQILSDRETVSFLPEVFSNTNEMYDAIKSFYYGILCEKIHPLAPLTGNLLGDLEKLFQDLKGNSFNIEHIYIGKDSITKISSAIFKYYNFIHEALEYFYKNSPQFEYEKNKKKAKSIKAQEELENKVERFTKNPYISLKILQDAIDFYGEQFDEQTVSEGWNISSYFADNFKMLTTEKKEYSFRARLESLYSTLKGEFEQEHDVSYTPKKEIICEVKLFLDTCMDLVHYVKSLIIKRKDFTQVETDTSFYERLNPLFEELSKVIKLYDKVRNFCTKKPYSVEKFKLTFNAPTLCNGWDENKEMDNSVCLLQKKNKIYLAIINKTMLARNKKSTINSPFKGTLEGEKEDGYKKIIYKFFPDVTKSIPKCSTQLKEVKKYFADSNKQDFILFDAKKFIHPLHLSQEVYNLNNPEGTDVKKFQKAYLQETGDYEGYKSAVETWIDFCIRFVSSYKSTAHFDLQTLKKSYEYTDIPSFYDDLNMLLYSIRFEKVSTKQVDELVNRGEVLLFEIHNKDFKEKSTGKPNMHTLYWKAIFDTENLKDVVVKLNGEAELFYRKASLKENNIFIHKKGEKLVNKTTKCGDTIPDEIYKKICQIVEGKISLNNVNVDVKDYYEKSLIKTATHDIIKDKRYTKDSFLFHVPITLNYKTSNSKKINDIIFQYIQRNPHINVIGIDRGERHLLYITVVNQKGDILEQKTLNTISGVNYHKKLDIREKERDKSRKNWENIGKIAELKEGYLSYVVHEITKLIVKHNAIVVLEDLNFGFKRGRFKIEKQVYQKFEKALITKLNYLCFKDISAKEQGGILNGLQLTNKFESFSKMGKQNGVLFYLSANNTSKIDPVTGFVDRIKPKYTNVKNAQEFFQKFDSIVYNKSRDAFEFTYQEKTFVENSTKIWTLTSMGDTRFIWDSKANNNKGATKSINATEELKKTFSEAGIHYETGENFKEELVRHKAVILFKAVIFILRLMLTMRYSNAETEQDFMLSPVLIEGKKVFSSEDATPKLPQNADANGAYNIARKGLLMLEQINKEEESKRNTSVLTISNKDWFAYAQREDIVKRQIDKL